jgi:hypothetical protein
MQPFSSFLSGYFQNIRGSRKTGSSRAPDQEINFVGDAFRLCSRIKVPKFPFIKHSGYSHDQIQSLHSYQRRRTFKPSPD